MAPMIPVRRTLLAFALCMLPVPAFAVSQLTLSSPGGGVFVVSGRLESLTGVQIYVTYDGTQLSNPRVSLGNLITGHGMVGVPNAASNPIQVAAIAYPAVTASGTFATITFDAASPLSANSISISCKATDTNGKPTRNISCPNAVQSTSGDSGTTTGGTPAVSASSGDGSGSPGNIVSTPGGGSGGNSGGNSGGTPATTKITSSTGSGSTPVVLGGTVTLPPSDLGTGSQENRGTSAQPAEQPASQPKTVATEPTSAGAEKAASRPETAPGEATASKVAAPAAAPPAPVPVTSVVDRFRLFEGEKTVTALTALFDRDPAAPFTQSPAIAIADGKATVKVVVTNLSGDKVPTFSLTSAEYVTSRRLADGGWELEVRPERGAVKSVVKLFYNGVTQELPLTVTPKVDVALLKKGEVTQGDFLLFLTQRGTAAEPKFDLNGDGRRDYVDDYIFTANYLLQTEGKAGRQQPSPQKQ